MRLNQVTVSSTDIPRSIAFYRGLGLLPIVHSNDTYARFVCPEGGASFSVHLAAAARAPGTVVYFELRDLDETVARLKDCGYSFEADPVDQPWLWREAYLRDPDGNLICLYAPGQNRLYPPWRLPDSLPRTPQVDSIDHLVLTVRSLEETVAFYERALGMESRRFGKGRVALHFGDQKLSLQPIGGVTDANVRHATPGSADLCLLTSTPIDQVATHLASIGVTLIEGPGLRTGARGPIRSLYFYDPNENLIEVANEVAAT